MDKLRPVWRAAPLILLVYGIVRTFTEMLEVKASINGLTVGAPAMEQQWIYLAAYVRAFDSLFFYLALAALTAAAGRVLTSGRSA